MTFVNICHDYSVLKATTGSFLAALLAGMKPATTVRRTEIKMTIKADGIGKAAMAVIVGKFAWMTVLRTNWMR